MIERFFCLLAVVLAVSCNNLSDGAFGWAVCSSKDGAEYELTGGGRCAARGVKGTKTVLKSTGEDMREAILAAIAGYDVIVLDGSAGVFPISTTIVLDSVCNKTIVGVNGAVLRSIMQTTPELLEYIEVNRHKYDDDPADERGRYHMPVGDFAHSNKVAYTYRRALYDYTQDAAETFCHSGMFCLLNGSENLIFRNIAFEGTGTFRGLPDNMFSVRQRSHNVWVDHCSFTDPSRCCISAGSEADFITISRCHLRYTERSGDHTLGFLISSSDKSFGDRGHMNVTIAHCHFDNVWSRWPMARFGCIHAFNNYYDCVGGAGLNPRTESSFLVENNYFEDGARAFCRYHIDVNVPEAYQWKGNRLGTDDPVEDKGVVTVPYAYSMIDAALVKDDVLSDCGPKD